MRTGTPGKVLANEVVWVRRTAAERLFLRARPLTNARRGQQTGRHSGPRMGVAQATGLGAKQAQELEMLKKAIASKRLRRVILQTPDP